MLKKFLKKYKSFFELYINKMQAANQTENG